jgi:tetratricopeptide (TPR) repeat protein
MRHLTKFVAAVALLLPGAGEAQTQTLAPEAGGWVGQRVVTQFGAVLKVGRQVVPDPQGGSRSPWGNLAPFRIYRVERASGRWLWLVAEEETYSGWVPATQVVRFEEAIDYYTRVIRANPGYMPAYLRRGDAWGEKEEPDKAIADYDQAIRLYPRCAPAYAARGDAWIEKDEYARASADHDQAIRLEPGAAR